MSRKINRLLPNPKFFVMPNHRPKPQRATPRSLLPAPYSPLPTPYSLTPHSPLYATSANNFSRLRK